MIFCSSQSGSLPTTEQLKGKTPEQIDQIMKEQRVEGKPGDQLRIEKGNPNDPKPVKRGPYGRVSENGVKSDPIPLAGNPILK